MRVFKLAAVAATTAAAAAALAAPSQALTLGIGDPLFDGPGAEAWLERTAEAGGRDVRITLSWANTARSRPDRPADPASPSYDFTRTDAAVRAAAAADLEVLLLVSGAPAFAEAEGRPADLNAGTWKPDPEAFGAFMEAVAARYDGTFDPGGGAGKLPRVEAFQLWNEPNLSVYLTPQWTADKKPFAPAHYRRMVNAAYPRIKQASPRATVVMAGTAPYGDPIAGGPRMPPARFVREMLCLGGSAIKPTARARCADPIRLDAVAHHPYGVGNPFEDSYWPDDVSLGDLDRLTRAFSLAARKRYLVPARRSVPFWVTEFGWESKPDPTGLPQSRQAQWLGEAVVQLQRAGVDRALWYRIRDDLPQPSWGRSVQSGLYTHGGKAKTSASMFAFPVAAYRRSAGGATASALVPRSGRCTVQRSSGGRWLTVRRASCRAGAQVTATVPRGALVRVTAGSERSRSVRAPR